jgi:hypothetical protein
MVSKALASLDVWLVLADEVLADVDGPLDLYPDPEVAFIGMAIHLSFDLGNV